MNIETEPNKEYLGRIEGHTGVLSIPIKAYFTSILGSDRDSSTYQWDASGISQRDVLNDLEAFLKGSDNIGVPHIAVLFPHVTTVYRWGDPRIDAEKETNLHRVGLGNTIEIGEHGIPIPKPPYEIGCPAELHIVGHELRFRSTALTLGQYLNSFLPNGDITPIAQPNLIREFLESV